MADVTINELTKGTPAGGNVLPYSTGSNTLGVPVSALFQTVYSNVGVGTSSPRCSLDLGGNLGAGKGFRLGDYLELNEMEGYNNNAYLSMNAVQADVGLFAPVYAPGQGIIMMAAGGGSGTIDFKARNWNNSSTPVSIENFTQIMRLQYDGKVGIGTSNPQAKLDVNGDVKATNTAKAWVNWKGNTYNAQNECEINASYNISKVIRDGVGKYTVYFSTPSPVTNQYYVTFGGAIGGAGAGTRWLSFGSPYFNHVGKSTTSFVCECSFTYTNLDDASEAWVSVIGN